MDREKLVEVTNRSNATVLLKEDFHRFRLSLKPGETKKIKYGILQDIGQREGGKRIIYHYLLVKDPEALRESINVQEEREYWLTKEQIPSWINSCSLNEFKDALDFAPLGVKELIKSEAIKQPLNDVAKRAAIKEQLNFDVDLAIKHNKESLEVSEEEAASATKRRSSESSISVPGEETNTSKYNVTSRRAAE